MQSTACNAAHSVERRLARWLLQAHDRLERNEFAVTQELVAMMLGVSRPMVSSVAGTLQKAGLIGYQRGRVKVLDRIGLELAACECYEAAKAMLASVTMRNTLPGKSVRATMGQTVARTLARKRYRCLACGERLELIERSAMKTSFRPHVVTESYRCAACEAVYVLTPATGVVEIDCRRLNRCRPTYAFGVVHRELSSWIQHLVRPECHHRVVTTPRKRLTSQQAVDKDANKKSNGPDRAYHRQQSYTRQTYRSLAHRKQVWTENRVRMKFRRTVGPSSQPERSICQVVDRRDALPSVILLEVAYHANTGAAMVAHGPLHHLSRMATAGVRAVTRFGGVIPHVREGIVPSSSVITRGSNDHG